MQRAAIRPEVPDTSLLIPFFRDGTYEDEIRAAVRAGRLFLSSMTVLELYAGTRDAAEKRDLDGFVSSFERRGQVVVPRHADHVLGGILLSRQRRLTGEMAVRDHLADVLIVLSASQIGATVVTANVRHLGLWASLARRAGRDVRARTPQLNRTRVM